MSDSSCLLLDADFATTEFTPFLLQMIIRSPKGDPLPNAKVDFWQATTDGLYAYRSYALRGRFTTDANGNVEVLTVIPGDYGAAGNLRTGHFHIMMQDAEGQCERLTTQLYVCRGNNLDAMKNDLYATSILPLGFVRLLIASLQLELRASLAAAKHATLVVHPNQ